MEIRSRMRQVPLRLAAGPFLLHAGADKLATEDEERAKRLHAFASATYPVLARVEPRVFVRLLGTAEVALGVALLVPIVRGRLAGLALSAFSAGLLGLYLRTPGMRRQGSLRPTAEGTALAKDVWLLGIGLALATDKKRRRADGAR